MNYSAGMSLSFHLEVIDYYRKDFTSAERLSNPTGTYERTKSAI